MRLKPQTRASKWVVYGSLALVVVLVGVWALGYNPSPDQNTASNTKQYWGAVTTEVASYRVEGSVGRVVLNIVGTSIPPAHLLTCNIWLTNPAGDVVGRKNNVAFGVIPVNSSKDVIVKVPLDDHAVDVGAAVPQLSCKVYDNL